LLFRKIYYAGTVYLNKPQNRWMFLQNTSQLQNINRNLV